MGELAVDGVFRQLLCSLAAEAEASSMNPADAIPSLFEFTFEVSTAGGGVCQNAACGLEYQQEGARREANKFLILHLNTSLRRTIGEMVEDALVEHNEQDCIQCKQPGVTVQKKYVFQRTPGILALYISRFGRFFEGGPVSLPRCCAHTITAAKRLIQLRTSRSARSSTVLPDAIVSRRRFLFRVVNNR